MGKRHVRQFIANLLFGDLLAEAKIAGWKLGCDCCYLAGKEGMEKPPPPPYSSDTKGVSNGNSSALKEAG